MVEQFVRDSAQRKQVRQLMRQIGRGHHGGMRAVVELFHVRQNRAAQPGQTIVLAIGVKVGTKVGTHR